MSRYVSKDGREHRIRYWWRKKSMALHRRFVMLRKGLKAEQPGYYPAAVLATAKIAGVSDEEAKALVDSEREPWRLEATLVHECDGHCGQQARDGWWTFMWRYVFARPSTIPIVMTSEDWLDAELERIDWRCVYEAEAYGISARVWVANHRLERAVLEQAAKKIVENKYPRFWFGKPPSEEVALRLVKWFYEQQEA